jgi:hypothetical protein
LNNHKVILEEKELTVLIQVLSWAQKNGKDKSKVEIIFGINEKLKKCLEGKNIEQYTYLSGLDKKVKDYFLRIKSEYDLNMYHSIAAVIQNRKKFAVDDFLEYYKQKNMLSRPAIFEDEEALKKLILFVHRRLASKNKLK